LQRRRGAAACGSTSAASAASAASASGATSSSGGAASHGGGSAVHRQRRCLVSGSKYVKLTFQNNITKLISEGKHRSTKLIVLNNVAFEDTFKSVYTLLKYCHTIVFQWVVS
jgi:hypothetical protein